MAFDLSKFFEDIFKPGEDEIVTIMYDLPHGRIADNDEWRERRKMAEEWRQALADKAGNWNLTVNPSVTYNATGSGNADLPESCWMADQETNLDEVINNSTILLAMPEFSATAPLYYKTKKIPKLRVGSMPGAAKFMEESGLSADYSSISRKGKIIEKIVERAIAAEVEFSSGHKCYFDIKDGSPAQTDDGILHPERGGTELAVSNLPAGEVYCVPNEAEDSGTNGELPEKIGDEVRVYVIKNNRVVDVLGDSDATAELRGKFKEDPGWCNIAEFAIGINDKARVTGNVLEDEKTGFHWAYGRSDHLGGKVGVEAFNSKENVIHLDIVYAKGNPIVCSRLDVIFPDESRRTLILDGEVQVE
ncbi:MAG: hypothetical protein KAW12_15905 [Candidatus Aminicenantes bacterium]|nr:hypothetical protein [Candidatus Aminicenantes bacterium]